MGDVHSPTLRRQPLVRSSDRDEHQARHAERELDSDADHHDEPDPTRGHGRALVHTRSKRAGRMGTEQI